MVWALTYCLLKSYTLHVPKSQKWWYQDCRDCLMKTENAQLQLLIFLWLISQSKLLQLSNYWSQIEMFHPVDQPKLEHPWSQNQQNSMWFVPLQINFNILECLEWTAASLSYNSLETNHSQSSYPIWMDQMKSQHFSCFSDSLHP